MNDTGKHNIPDVGRGHYPENPERWLGRLALYGQARRAAALPRTRRVDRLREDTHHAHRQLGAISRARVAPSAAFLPKRFALRRWTIKRGLACTVQLARASSPSASRKTETGQRSPTLPCPSSSMTPPSEAPPLPGLSSFSPETRSALADFARVATPKDAGVMNELVQLWFNLARTNADSPASVEGRPANSMQAVRAKFMRFRFLARDCSSFRQLAPDDRVRISKVIFEMPAAR